MGSRIRSGGMSFFSARSTRPLSASEVTGPLFLLTLPTQSSNAVYPFKFFRSMIVRLECQCEHVVILLLELCMPCCSVFLSDRGIAALQIDVQTNRLR